MAQRPGAAGAGPPDQLLSLRDEGLQLLTDGQRGVLLNAIAGCYSVQDRSEEAIAYMYQPLHGAGPARGHGFDAALHCDLSHDPLCCSPSAKRQAPSPKREERSRVRVPAPAPAG